jgi:broad specificity phosphatase PhoE
MNLYFVRHGECVLAKMDLISNRDFPYGLTKTGIAQAEELAKTLQDTPFAAHYSSPIPRAGETSRILSRTLGLPINYDPDLCEADMGELEGKQGADALKREMEIFENWLVRGELETRIPGGESRSDIEERFFRFMRRLESDRYGGDSNILIVAHAGLFMCVLPRLCPDIPIDFAYHHVPQNCGIIHI